MTSQAGVKVHITEDFTAANFAGEDFSGHKFISCTFSYARSTESTVWYGTEFHGCVMSYFNAPNSLFDRTSFVHCEVGFANFKKAKFEHSNAVWTNFGGATFKEADVKSLMTNNCDFFTSRIQYAASINPYSRDMIAEILRIDAKDDMRKLGTAAFIKNSPDLCWRDLVVLAKTDHYKPISKDILECLMKMGMVSERNLERYKNHDVID